MPTVFTSHFILVVYCFHFSVVCLCCEHSRFESIEIAIEGELEQKIEVQKKTLFLW